jgi:hypothetical protein
MSNRSLHQVEGPTDPKFPEHVVYTASHPRVSWLRIFITELGLLFRCSSLGASDRGDKAHGKDDSNFITSFIFFTWILLIQQ